MVTETAALFVIGHEEKFDQTSYKMLGRVLYPPNQNVSSRDVSTQGATTTVDGLVVSGLLTPEGSRLNIALRAHEDMLIEMADVWRVRPERRSVPITADAD